MKIFLKIIKYRFTVSLKHPVILICLSAAIICSVLVGIYAQINQTNSSKYPIALVDEDGGIFAKDFINNISKNDTVDVIILSRDKAKKQVSTGKIDGAFVIINGFSDKIENNDYSDIVEFISPSVTTSAYPVSEIVLSEIMDMWLMQLVGNSLLELHSDFGGNALLSYEEIMDRAKSQYISEDILTIDYIGDTELAYKREDILPIDKAMGVYAAFVIFAIMLSSEWIFNIKKRSLQSRFISHNASITIVCLGSQVASVLVCMLFFLPLIIFLGIYLSIGIYQIMFLVLGMFLFSLSICLIAFIASTFAANLTQLVVLGASISIINILISSLVMPMPDWSAASGLIAKILPGTYLLGCQTDLSKLTMLLGITIFWAGTSYFAVKRIEKKAKVV